MQLVIYTMLEASSVTYTVRHVTCHIHCKADTVNWSHDVRMEEGSINIIIKSDITVNSGTAGSCYNLESNIAVIMKGFNLP